MKAKLTLAFIILLAGTSYGQSSSFELLRDKFIDTENVQAISVGGFFCRTVMWMTGEDELREAIQELKHVRMITIPKQNFRQQKLSLAGFKKVLQSDRFESIAAIAEPDEKVEVFMQQTDSRTDRYFVLVEDNNEVVAIELKGKIDVAKLKSMHDDRNYRNL